MTDSEKVIKGLECCISIECDHCPYYVGKVFTCEENMLKDALALLEEHECKAVKPEVERSGGGITWWNVCGACKTAINPNDKYCHECGVTIDWGEKR